MMNTLQRVALEERTYKMKNCSQDIAESPRNIVKEEYGETRWELKLTFKKKGNRGERSA